MIVVILLLYDCAFTHLLPEPPLIYEIGTFDLGMV